MYIHATDRVYIYSHNIVLNTGLNQFYLLIKTHLCMYIMCVLCMHVYYVNHVNYIGVYS